MMNCKKVSVRIAETFFTLLIAFFYQILFV